MDSKLKEIAKDATSEALKRCRFCMVVLRDKNVVIVETIEDDDILLSTIWQDGGVDYTYID